ncbi:MAG: Arc family DNA-binding protein [Planctomycetes bacterium]|nr:Arc family DNA-binding protein [Planctomycetota bacterium]
MAKKQLLLRIEDKLWNALKKWADDEFRSINGQIEFLLTEAVKKHDKKFRDDEETRTK